MLDILLYEKIYYSFSYSSRYKVMICQSSSWCIKKQCPRLNCRSNTMLIPDTPRSIHHHLRNYHHHIIIVSWYMTHLRICSYISHYQGIILVYIWCILSFYWGIDCIIGNFCWLCNSEHMNYCLVCSYRCKWGSL